MRFGRLTYAVILTGAAAWCALILLAPALSSSPALAPLGAVLYAFFGPLCHQIDSRLFHLFGSPLAVCGRCSSIYFGFLLGAIAYPVVRRLPGSAAPGMGYLVAAAAPMMLDVCLEALGFYDSSNLIRALTGAWFGVLLPFLIIPGAVEGIHQLTSRSNPQWIQPEKGLPDA